MTPWIISNTSLKWFESYLHVRQQNVDCERICFSTAHIFTGVPLWSILGAPLSINYMNDTHMASQNYDIILYADGNTNLIRHSSLSIANESIEHLLEQISIELSNIQEWLNTHTLWLYVKKTKFMIFHHHQLCINNIIPTLKINSQTIEKVRKLNFLGLTIDEHLNRKSHTQKISNKIARTLGIMYHLTNVLHTHILRVLYKFLILSHLQYSIL